MYLLEKVGFMYKSKLIFLSEITAVTSKKFKQLLSLTSTVNLMRSCNELKISQTLFTRSYGQAKKISSTYL